MIKAFSKSDKIMFSRVEFTSDPCDAIKNNELGLDVKQLNCKVILFDSSEFSDFTNKNQIEANFKNMIEKLGAEYIVQD